MIVELRYQPLRRLKLLNSGQIKQEKGGQHPPFLFHVKHEKVREINFNLSYFKGKIGQTQTRLFSRFSYIDEFQLKMRKAKIAKGLHRSDLFSWCFE